MTLPWLALRRALVRRPETRVDTPELINQFGYRRAQDLALAQSQHDAFAAALRADGVDVFYHDAPLPELADAIYVCDPVLMTPAGAIILRMGKAARSAEPAAIRARLEELGVRIHGVIEAPGCVEGGDCLWLDPHTLAVGEGYRTNPHGIEQLRALLPHVEVLVIQLPHHHGPEECMHLQSLLSFADLGLAVVHLPMAPVRLVRALEQRDVHMLPLPPEDFETLGSNFICTSPRHVILPGGNERTAQVLRGAGVEVVALDADELMWVGSGGPTCLTLPLRRA